MEYKKTTEFNGSGADALDAARSVFINNNFRIQTMDGGGIVAIGPGLNSTRQNPLLGATVVKITAGTSSLALEASLGGIARMRTFLYAFPPVLGIVLSAVFLVIPGMPLYAAAIPWLAISPWAVLAPVMVGRIKKSTVTALDTLLANIALPRSP
jgi:hypothetical protein